MSRSRPGFPSARRGPFALIGAVSLLVAGCLGTTSTTTFQAAPGSAGGSPKLLFISNGNSDWWTAVETGMREAGKDLGCQVELRRNDKGTPGQIRILEDALSLPDIQGVAISVWEAEAPGIIDKLQALKDQGKVVLCIDSDVAPQYAEVRRAYIGTINRKAGEAAGRAAKALRPQGGKVVGFVGTSSAANAIQRVDGFLDGAGAGFVKAEVFDDANEDARARSNVQTAISKYPDLGVLLGIWSYNAPIIGEEVGNSPEVRKKATVVTFDLAESAVGQIAKGNIDASVCQNPFEMGYQGVKLLKAYIAGDEKTVAEVLPDGKMRDTGVRIIVPRADSPVMSLKGTDGKPGDDVVTIEEMTDWLASKGLKSS